MGLDSVEIVIAVEEEFDITIPDFYGAKIVTVGGLVDHVYAAVNGFDPEQEREEWQRLAEDVQKVTGRKFDGLSSTTRIIDVLDPEREAEQWEELGFLPPVRLPPELAKRVAIVYHACFWLPSLGLFALGGFELNSIPGCLGLGFLVLIVVWLFWQRSLNRQREIPQRDLTFESIVWWRSPKPDEDTSRESVATKVRRIVVDQLSVKPERVTEDARFIEDLGVG